jgi:hypothetical protein
MHTGTGPNHGAGDMVASEHAPSPSLISAIRNCTYGHKLHIDPPRIWKRRGNNGVAKRGNSNRRFVNKTSDLQFHTHQTGTTWSQRTGCSCTPNLSSPLPGTIVYVGTPCAPETLMTRTRKTHRVAAPSGRVQGPRTLGSRRCPCLPDRPPQGSRAGTGGPRQHEGVQSSLP